MFFQSWALKNSQNPSWANVGVVEKHSVIEVFLVLSSSVTFVVENAFIKKDKQAESLYPAFCQRASEIGANRKAERSKPLYQ